MNVEEHAAHEEAHRALETAWRLGARLCMTCLGPLDIEQNPLVKCAYISRFRSIVPPDARRDICQHAGYLCEQCRWPISVLCFEHRQVAP